MTNNNEKKGEWKEFKNWAYIVFALWLISGIVIKLIITDEAKQGQFGDMFGAVNALFSGLTFAGLIYTILLQRNSIDMQKEQIDIQKEEFKAQKSASMQERFENTFFQMLSLHNEIVNNLSFDNAMTSKSEKKDVFREMYDIYIKNEVKTKYHKGTNGSTYIDQLPFIKEEEIELLINEGYTKYLEDHKYVLGHYFTNLFQILNYIDRTDLIINTNKQLYCDILMSQLSSYELLVLFYEAITNTQYFELVVKYNILKNMNFKELPSDKHKDLYDSKAKSINLKASL